MKRIGAIFLVLAFFIATRVSQSGRKIIEKPSPTPQIEVEKNYSESTPAVKNPIYISNKRRRERLAEAVAPVNTKAESIDDEDELIKIESTLITIPVSVYSHGGVYVRDLDKENFQVFEEDSEQEIELFGATDKPFTVVLLLDTSYSADNKIADIQSAARAFIRQLQPEDRVMVIEFDRNNHVLSEFTNDREKLYKAIGKADFGYGTSLYDAVRYSIGKKLSGIQGRKAIVLFTDGVDTTSRKSTYDETVLDSEESGAIVFPIYYDTFAGVQRQLQKGNLSPAGTTPADYAVGKKYINDLAAYTGGRVFFPETTRASLTEAFEGIAQELRRQYFIGYYPNQIGENGERRNIKVRVNRPNLVVRARDSYVVGASQQASPSN